MDGERAVYHKDYGKWLYKVKDPIVFLFKTYFVNESFTEFHEALVKQYREFRYDV